jgi:hypothetical protein
VLDFAIIGLPRSGTTWAANWLTTDRSLCLHDPLTEHTLDDLAAWREPGKLVGVACTGLWQFPEWVAANVRNVVLLDRDIADIDRSLIEIGLGPMPPAAVEQFAAMVGRRFLMEELFNSAFASDIWHALVPGLSFDYARHELLTSFMVNPHFPSLEPSPRAVKDWVKRLQEAATQ